MNEIKLKGFGTVEVFDKEGTLISKNEFTNLITSAGKAAIAALIGNISSPTAFGYLAVGSSATAPAIGDTTLTAEISTNGLSRAAVTPTQVTTTVTNDTIQFVKSFSVSGSSTVQEVGIFNASPSGIMLGHALTGGQSVVNTNTFVVTYKVQFT